MLISPSITVGSSGVGTVILKALTSSLLLGFSVLFRVFIYDGTVAAT